MTIKRPKQSPRVNIISQPSLVQVLLLASLLFGTTKAKIVEEGLWTGINFTRYIGSPDEYTVENGKTTFLHESKARHVKSANMK